VRKLVVSSFMTLDGVSEDPAGFDGTGLGGWSLPFFDAEAAEAAHGLLRVSDLFVCGRATYDGFAKFGPAMTGKYADALNAMPKLVASRTLKEPLSWNAHLINGDVGGAVADLKQQPGGGIVSYGGGQLARILASAGLVDEYKIWVFPLVLGGGEHLFRPGATRSDLALADTKRLQSGIMILTYVPATHRPSEARS
jgi:dihydrofolate reductase